MKKKILAALTMAALLFTLCTSAFATEYPIDPCASDYIVRVGVSLSANGGGQMTVKYDVVGKGIMDKVGVMSISIDQKVDGKWKPYTSFSAVNHEDYYDYDTISNAGSQKFSATPGVTYRATVIGYARNSSGSDTSSATSGTTVCR